MVAMCLVKDQTKRPTAERLLKHSFFKSARPPEVSLKNIFSDLPPLGERVKILKVCKVLIILAVSRVISCLNDISRDLTNWCLKLFVLTEKRCGTVSP